jgi:hypothetical protein
MNTIMKTALGAAMLGGAALAGTAPANAAVVGVTIGVPGVAVGYYAPNPCYGPYAWRPAYCYAGVYGGYYGVGYYAPYRFYGGRYVVTRGRYDRDDFRDRDGDGRRDVR